VNPGADLSAENVVHEPVLGNLADASECGRGYDGVEMPAVAADVCAGARNAGLDPILQLLRGRVHALKRSEMLPLY